MSFGRLGRPTAERPISDINVTPLVDVMLVLLVIFIIAAPLMASRLALELPRTEAPAASPGTPPSVVTIALDASGRLHWNGEALSPDEDALRERLRAAAGRDPSTEVQLHADATVPYGRVVRLIGLAQAAGLSHIGFVADAVPVPTVR